MISVLSSTLGHEFLPMAALRSLCWPWSQLPPQCPNPHSGLVCFPHWTISLLRAGTVSAQHVAPEDPAPDKEQCTVFVEKIDT